MVNGIDDHVVLDKEEGDLRTPNHTSLKQPQVGVAGCRQMLSEGDNGLLTEYT